MSESEFKTRVKVVGVGGAGIKAVNRMIDAGLSGVEFAVVDFDLMDLRLCKAAARLELKSLYPRLTFPEFGNAARLRKRESAMAGQEQIRNTLGEADVVFIIAGLGGHTGSGVAPVVAETARQKGAFTIGLVTLPFTFEGRQRHEIAEEVVKELCSRTDTLTTISPYQILQMASTQKMSVNEAFDLVDDILQRATQNILSFITTGLPPDLPRQRAKIP